MYDIGLALFVGLIIYGVVSHLIGGTHLLNPNKSNKMEIYIFKYHHYNLNIVKGPRYPYLKDKNSTRNLKKVDAKKTPKFAPNPWI